ncbi:MAG: hypothetical protein IJV16_04025 [Lachnospiraceae bacterium]|nr:hypothetical protein [Lachnospiraceae bacterium]
MNEPRTQSELLSWTHYRILTQVEDEAARKWYAREAYEQMWSSTVLQRNVSSQYYYRILKTQDKTGVEDEIVKMKTSVRVRLCRAVAEESALRMWSRKRYISG